MNIQKLVQGLSYVGEAEGKRQSYYVFRGRDDFLVLSFSKRKPQAGNFNVVDAKAVEFVRNRFRGKKGITSNDVAARSRRLPGSLVALNVLYVLVALGEAKVDTRRAGPKLYFNVGDTRLRRARIPHDPRPRSSMTRGRVCRGGSTPARRGKAP